VFGFYCLFGAFLFFVPFFLFFYFSHFYIFHFNLCRLGLIDLKSDFTSKIEPVEPVDSESEKKNSFLFVLSGE
jgi:hypothetical protein